MNSFYSLSVSPSNSDNSGGEASLQDNPKDHPNMARGLSPFELDTEIETTKTPFLEETPKDDSVAREGKLTQTSTTSNDLVQQMSGLFSNFVSNLHKSSSNR